MLDKIKIFKNVALSIIIILILFYLKKLFVKVKTIYDNPLDSLKQKFLDEKTHFKKPNDEVTAVNENNEVTTFNENNEVTTFNENNEVTTFNEDNEVTTFKEDNLGLILKNDNNRITSIFLRDKLRKIFEDNNFNNVFFDQNLNWRYNENLLIETDDEDSTIICFNPSESVVIDYKIYNTNTIINIENCFEVFLKENNIRKIILQNDLPKTVNLKGFNCLFKIFKNKIEDGYSVNNTYEKDKQIEYV